MLAPWPFGYAASATVNSVVCGVAILASGVLRGRIASRFGGGWATVFRAR